MVKIEVGMYGTREVKIAFDNASNETGMYKRDIAYAALKEWLIAHGYLDPHRKIAL